MPETGIGDVIAERWKVQGIRLGGLGVVYLVSDRDGSVYVAKTYQTEKVKDQPEWRQRFVQECTAWIAIDPDPNITKALLIREFAGKPYVIMDYVEGGSLEELIRNAKLTVNLPHTLHLAMQFCDGMGHAYKNGIIAHRDIKPANCLIDSQNVLKVSDFGLARANSVPERPVVSSGAVPKLVGAPPKSGRLTGRGIGMGTTAYMSPEQFEDFRSVDSRGDIYSFGVMLFEMVTGHRPFDAKTDVEWYRMHKDAIPPRIVAPAGSKWPQGIVSRLDALAQSCLAKLPRNRPQSFEEIRSQLGDIYQQLTGASAPTRLPPIPLTARDLMFRGESFASLKKWDSAVDCLTQALVIAPENHHAEFELATTYYLMGNQVDALRHFDKALALDPKSSVTWANRAGSLEVAGRYDEALQSCERALTLNPQERTAIAIMGHIALRRGLYAAARDCYIKAIAIYAFDPLYPYNLARAFRGLADMKAAETFYRLSLDLDDQSAITWYDLGNLLQEASRGKEAIDCYDKALQCDPKHSKAMTNKGVALVSVQRYADALTCFENALNTDPKDDVAWTMKGEVLFAFYQKHRDALACYMRAKELGREPPPGRVEACKSHI